MRVKPNLVIFLIGLVLLGLLGCSDPQLEMAQSRSKVTLTGEFLTTNPDVVNFPVRIVIAIDDSGSMITSDPEDANNGIPMRLEAAWEFINSYRDFESVQFDVIHWNSTIAQTTGGFSRNFDELYNDVFTYNNQDETNYTGTLSTIQDHFVQEISEMRNDDALSANIARMRCIVLFFSDGLPDPWNEASYGPIYQQIRNMEERIVDVEGAASFRFHALLLSVGLQAWPALHSQAQTLMIHMASAGNGVYEEFESASEINFINVVDMRLTIEYKVKFIIAFNTNVIPGEEIVYVDSDGDGLTDEEELDLDLNHDGEVDVDEAGQATDPADRDTDDDGLSDFLERRLSTIDEIFDPTDPSDSACPIGAEEIDRDRDGMMDYEEVIKGTSYINPDTDNDGIPDGIEFLVGSDPFSSQDSQDSDFDGVDDWVEVQRHTNVAVNDVRIRQLYSYYYDIRDKGLFEMYQDSIFESRRRRISFNISNIDIMPTLAANGREEGDNLIRMFIAEVPQDMPDSNPVYRVADILVNYYDTESRVIEVDSFEAL